MQSSEFDSFLFWRQPIAALDLGELCELGLTDSEPTNESAEEAGLDEDQELQEFSAFHFWRAPLVSVDALIHDLELLL
ncbi:protein AF1q [Boleophthalmus pectinirostris]|uniref:protein AF1q n=1 Tax=Boleophthalmus pectinirostris TaxID=150288 RepID=UPI00242D895F|nr:protein AF1q [Boleophthalmus pectinirostris]